MGPFSVFSHTQQIVWRVESRLQFSTTLPLTYVRESGNLILAGYSSLQLDCQMSFSLFNLTASPTTPFNNPSFTPSPYPTHDFIISPPPHGLALGLHNHSSFTTRSPQVLPATEVPNVGRRSKKLKQISLYVDPTIVFGRDRL